MVRPEPATEMSGPSHSLYPKEVVPEKVIFLGGESKPSHQLKRMLTVAPDWSLVRARVSPAGTAMLLRTMLEHADCEAMA